MEGQRRRFFRHRPIRNKNWRLQPCLLTDQEKTSNLYIFLLAGKYLQNLIVIEYYSIQMYHFISQD
jgi:hypothetical protein